MPPSELNSFNLREAINAVSDVVQNRPRPIRQFDQIYMKTGDMVMQSEMIARWADGKRLAFVGDGDAISVCVAYLKERDVIDYGPSKITVFDFDERIVDAITRFADKERLEYLSAELYNVFDPIPNTAPDFDRFYTNPPWGQYNKGESVKLFIQRGFELLSNVGEGVVVIADSHELDWPQEVLAHVQAYALENKFYVSSMRPELHLYHLDDAPDLRSCNLCFRSTPQNEKLRDSRAIASPEELENFYGRSKAPRVRYVRKVANLNYGAADENEYKLELLEDEDE